MEPCIENLKGKILEKPKHHLWRLNKQANKNVEYKYTVENTEEEWTPYNSNLQMQGIKVSFEWGSAALHQPQRNENIRIPRDKLQSNKILKES